MSNHPTPHVLPLKRFKVTYACAHKPGANHRVVIRAANQQSADAIANAVLAGQVVTVKQLPDRISWPTLAGTACAAAGALVQVCGNSGPI